MERESLIFFALKCQKIAKKFSFVGKIMLYLFIFQILFSVGDEWGVHVR